MAQKRSAVEAGLPDRGEDNLPSELSQEAIAWLLAQNEAML